MSSHVFIRDVSFAGSTITITGPTGSAVIADFMDDANPIEFQDVEVSTVGVNCNGAIIRNAKPNVVMASITVIPYSESDAKLYEMWSAYRVQGEYKSEWEHECQLDVVLGTGTGGAGGGTGKKDYHLSCGTMVSGPGGPSANGEGKMQGRTYTFAFAKVN